MSRLGDVDIAVVVLCWAGACLFAQLLVVVDETARDDDDALVPLPQKHPRTIAQSYPGKSARSSISSNTFASILLPLQHHLITGNFPIFGIAKTKNTTYNGSNSSLRPERSHHLLPHPPPKPLNKNRPKHPIRPAITEAAHTPEHLLRRSHTIACLLINSRHLPRPPHPSEAWPRAQSHLHRKRWLRSNLRSCGRRQPAGHRTVERSRNGRRVRWLLRLLDLPCGCHDGGDVR